MIRRNFDISKYTYFAILATIAAAYTLMFGLTPPVIDDLMFEGEYLEDNNGDPTFSLNAWLQYIANVRLNDNSRISNMMAPFSTAIEPWRTLFPLVTAACYTALIVLVTGLFDKAKYPCVGTLAVWLAMTLFLPWRNSILVADYALNYIYSSLISIVFVTAFIRIEQRHSWNFLKLWCMILLAIAAGGWHEGFAVPIICGLAVITIVRHRTLSRQWRIVLSTYALAAALFALSPGMINRAVHEATYSYPFTKVLLLKFIIDLLLPIIAVISLIACAFIRRLRSKLLNNISDPFFIAFAIAMLMSAMLSLAFHHTPRTAFFPTLCSLIVIGKLFGANIFAWLGRGKWRGLIFAWAVYLLCVVHACVVIYWSSLIYDENRQIMAEFNRNDNITTVFHDIIPPEDVPAATLYFPARIHWITPYHLRCLDNVLRRSGCVVVPTALEYAAEGNSEELGEGSRFYRKGDALWFRKPSDMNCYYEAYFDIILGDGRRLENRPAFVQTFTTAAGDRIEYVKVHKIKSTDIARIDLRRYSTY